MRRRVLAALALAAGAIAVAIALAGGSGHASDATRPVVVLRHAVRGGTTLDPDALLVVDYPAPLVPAGALGSVGEAAFRTAAVGLPAGLPLFAGLFRDPATALGLGRGERAVGVRVDDVTGLPELLSAGVRVDVLVRGRLQVADAEVIGRPRRTGDGISWSVALRLPEELAAALGRAEARGDEIRLLPRGPAR